jgi:hypothetical protein
MMEPEDYAELEAVRRRARMGALDSVDQWRLDLLETRERREQAIMQQQTDSAARQWENYLQQRFASERELTSDVLGGVIAETTETLRGEIQQVVTAARRAVQHEIDALRDTVNKQRDEVAALVKSLEPLKADVERAQKERRDKIQQTKREAQATLRVVNMRELRGG